MNCNPANPKENGIVNVWQETYPVRFGSIDKSDRLTLDEVFRFFQEAAISHAENLGVGREDLAKTGRVWIISRMTVIVNRRPNYLETVTVKTWPQGSEKLFAVRYYEIRGKDGDRAVAARSAWLVVDIEKRRPLRPQQVVETLPLNEGLEALPPEAAGAAGIAQRDNLREMEGCKTVKRKALYTDMDYNSHVNNVRYIQWIEDSLDPQLLENADKMRLDINYLNEILSGEEIEIITAPVFDEENGKNTRKFAIEGQKENGQAAFRAELALF